MSLDDFYQSCGIPKPIPRKRLKAREKATEADHIHILRMYLVGRERNLCRCCMIRPCESMHELRFRSLGGLRTRTNSVMLCGSGTTGCHGHCQEHRIDVAIVDERRGAQGPLLFIPRTESAATHMRLTINHALESRPGSERDDL